MILQWVRSLTPTPFPRLSELLLAMWVGASAVFVALGWLASAAGALNLLTYSVTVGLLLAIGLALLIMVRWPRATTARRFRRWLPFSFALIALLVFLGGISQPPTNYDGLSYRMGRLMQWLSAGHWHWMVTHDERMNYMAANFEWLTAPLLLLVRSDRVFFLLNYVPFLFLPGLLFSVYRMMGVSGRVAWFWMWILPTGYCYALQAASIGNDSISAVLVLTAMFFALRAAKSRQFMHVSLAIMAIALATGIKGSNLPLMLPCVVALWPSRRLVVQNKFAITLTFIAALLVSFAPTALLNHRQTGSWIGNAQKVHKVSAERPSAGLIGNTIQLGVQMLQPPVLPGARWLSLQIPRLLPNKINEMLSHDFARFAPTLGEIPQEESTGMGLGITVLLAMTLFGRIGKKRRPPSERDEPQRLPRAVNLAAWGAFLFYMSTVGSEATARLVAPYYPLLLPFVLAHPFNEQLTRKKSWALLTLASVVGTMLLIVITPSRPLWPANTVLARLARIAPGNSSLSHARTVYAVYGQRNDVLAPLRDCLPANAKNIGLIAELADLEYSLWRPFGSRRLTYMTGRNSFQHDAAGLTWIVGKSSLLPQRYGMSVEQLATETHGKLITRMEITSRVAQGPEEWFVLQIPAP